MKAIIHPRLALEEGRRGERRLQLDELADVQCGYACPERLASGSPSPWVWGPTEGHLSHRRHPILISADCRKPPQEKVAKTHPCNCVLECPSRTPPCLPDGLAWPRPLTGSSWPVLSCATPYQSPGSESPDGAPLTHRQPRPAIASQPLIVLLRRTLPVNPPAILHAERQVMAFPWSRAATDFKLLHTSLGRLQCLAALKIRNASLQGLTCLGLPLAASSLGRVGVLVCSSWLAAIRGVGRVIEALWRSTPSLPESSHKSCYSKCWVNGAAPSYYCVSPSVIY